MPEEFIQKCLISSVQFPHHYFIVFHGADRAELVELWLSQTHMINCISVIQKLKPSIFSIDHM